MLISSSVSVSPMHSNWKSCKDWENFCTAADRSVRDNKQLCDGASLKFEHIHFELSVVNIILYTLWFDQTKRKEITSKILQ